MTPLGDRMQQIWEWVQGSPAILPTRLQIPIDHIDGSMPVEPFKRDQHYFQIRVNEMFLSKRRSWLSAIEPMVFFASEFTYGAERQVVPTVVGPDLVRKLGVETPGGMIISNTRVAGTHPYRGGELTLSVVLFQAPSKNYARELVRLIEGAASALDFATALSSYLHIAKVVVDGVELLLGQNETVPVAGLRTTFDPNADDRFEPGYFVLIAPSETQYDSTQFWVRDHQLLHGPTSSAARPFRAADYVLYSITQTSQREDIQTLPFFALVNQMNAAATRPDKESWSVAKANMVALAQALVGSNDLTPVQADTLYTAYLTEIKRLRERAMELDSLGSLGGETRAVDELTDAQRKAREAASVLDLP